jgi:hypothetical protein
MLAYTANKCKVACWLTHVRTDATSSIHTGRGRSCNVIKEKRFNGFSFWEHEELTVELLSSAPLELLSFAPLELALLELALPVEELSFARKALR